MHQSPTAKFQPLNAEIRDGDGVPGGHVTNHLTTRCGSNVKTITVRKKSCFIFRVTCQPLGPRYCPHLLL